MPVPVGGGMLNRREPCTRSEKESYPCIGGPLHFFGWKHVELQNYLLAVGRDLGVYVRVKLFRSG